MPAFALGFLEVVDKLLIAPWRLVLRIAIRQWSVSYDERFGQMHWGDYGLINAREYDFCVDSTFKDFLKLVGYLVHQAVPPSSHMAGDGI